MVSQCTKYEVSRFTRYEAVNGGAKCRKWSGQGALEVNGNVTIRQSAYDFLFDFNRNHASILYRFRDISGYLSRHSRLFVESRRFLPTAPAFGAPIGGDPICYGFPVDRELQMVQFTNIGYILLNYQAEYVKSDKTRWEFITKTGNSNLAPQHHLTIRN